MRLGASTHRLVSSAAERQGTTLAEYIREASLLRAAWENGLAHGGEPLPLLERLTEEIRALRQDLRAANGEH